MKMPCTIDLVQTVDENQHGESDEERKRDRQQKRHIISQPESVNRDDKDGQPNHPKADWGTIYLVDHMYEHQRG